MTPSLYELAHPMSGDASMHAIPGAKNFGPSRISRAIRRYAPHLGVPWSKFPRLGDERGDRAEIERFNLPSFPCNIGNAIVITKDIPVGGPLLALAINPPG